MTASPHPSARENRCIGSVLSALCTVTALGLTTTACGEGKKDKVATQVAAKVNTEEISVHQINYLLQQQRGLRAEQRDAVADQALERLIDQELALQKAQELKLDREPRVMQQIEAARRELIARAYIEKSAEAVAKPSPEAVKQYYDTNPWLFKERRIYSIQELSVEVKPEQMEAMRAQLKAAKSVKEFVEYLKASNLRFVGNQAVRAAEQLPQNAAQAFSRLKDGEAMLLPSPTGAQVIVRAASRAEPLDEARARPAIENFLLSEAKRKVVEDDLKALRAAAKIEYVGKYAGKAGAAPPQAGSGSAIALPGGAASSGLDANAINKGMGFK